MTGNAFYGWYDDAAQPVDQPTYDPPHHTPCLFCGHALTDDDVRTISIMMQAKAYAKRAYFYRVHRTCAEAELARDPASNGMDAAIWSMIARNGD